METSSEKSTEKVTVSALVGFASSRVIETVGGVVVVRYGENPMATIQRVKDKIAGISAGLPRKTLEDGTESQVSIVPFYDRTGLINETLGTLNTALVEEILVTIIVILVSVMHLRSSILISALLPLAVLMCFIAMRVFGVDANIVALSGIAIAIGTMVDMGIILCENILTHLDDADPEEDRLEVVFRASSEVGGAVLTAVATTIVSFLPVFTLEAQEGRMFAPLAYTKTLAMFFASLLSITLVPVLMVLLIRGRIAPERKHPISRALIWLYRPFVWAALRWRKSVALLAVLALAATWPAFQQLGSEFMPPLWEGSTMYMPTMLPGASIGGGSATFTSSRSAPALACATAASR